MIIKTSIKHISPSELLSGPVLLNSKIFSKKSKITTKALDLYCKAFYPEPKLPENSIAVYFYTGRAYKITPEPKGTYYDNRDMIYNADYYIIEGKVIDLTDIESIRSIKPPKFDPISDNAIFAELEAVGYLDYALRMKAGQYYDKPGCEQLCSACLWKSTELMLNNDWAAWSFKDYARLIYWHYELGMTDEAKKAIDFLAAHGMKDMTYNESFDSIAKNSLNLTLSQAAQLQTDLVVFNDYGTGCCEICAAFGGRVYSLSGKNPRFPILPEYVKEHGNFHPGCRCTMSPYLGGDIFYRGEKVEPYYTSMRSYADDRSNEQYELYQKYLQKSEEKENEHKKRLERSILRGQHRKEYMYFKINHPDICPKTIDGYIKGKKTKSKKFAQLLKIAEQDGFPIDL